MFLENVVEIDLVLSPALHTDKYRMNCIDGDSFSSYKTDISPKFSTFISYFDYNFTFSIPTTKDHSYKWIV